MKRLVHASYDHEDRKGPLRKWRHRELRTRNSDENSWCTASGADHEDWRGLLRKFKLCVIRHKLLI